MKFLIVLCIGVFFTSYGQQSFPESWEGVYKGELHVYDVDSVKMKVMMGLEITKTENDSIFDWTIIYDFKGKKDKRAYSLVIVNKQNGHYQIDEKNSIIIDAYFHNSTILTSFFKVKESFISASYTKEDKHILFEIISSKTEPESSTGNRKHGDEEIPEVTSFFVHSRHQALLKKLE